MPPTSQPSAIQVIVTASNYTVFLTYVMIGLTLVIGLLTYFVFRYAKRTLEATQESLDFFTKPLVAFKSPTDLKFKVHALDTSRTIARFSIQLVNESPQPIRIDSPDDISSGILLEKSSQAASLVRIDFNKKFKRWLAVKREQRITWPLFLYEALHINFDFALKGDKQLPDEAVNVVVELHVKYTYRGRQYHEVKEFPYTLGPS